MREVCTEAVDCVALWTRVTLRCGHVWSMYRSSRLVQNSASLSQKFSMSWLKSPKMTKFARNDAAICAPPTNYYYLNLNLASCFPSFLLLCLSSVLSPLPHPSFFLPSFPPFFFPPPDPSFCLASQILFDIPAIKKRAIGSTPHPRCQPLDIPFLVGNPNLNLDLPLASWVSYPTYPICSMKQPLLLQTVFLHLVELSKTLSTAFVQIKLSQFSKSCQERFHWARACRDRFSCVSDAFNWWV